MGEDPPLNCIFGCCEEEDDLKHYLVCDPLWTMATSACGLPSLFLSGSPLERMCLINRSGVSLKLLSVVYRGYHALKVGHRGLIDKCSADNVYDELLLLLLDLCAELYRHH